MPVLFNAVPDAIDVIDSGQSRSTSQRMAIKNPGLVAPSKQAAITRCILIATNPGSHVGVVEYLEQEKVREKYCDGIDFVIQNCSGSGWSRAPVQAALAVAYSQNPARVQVLIRKASSGANLSENSPELALHNYINGLSSASKAKTEAKPIFKKVLKACKAAFEGEKLKILKEDNQIFSYFGFQTNTPKRRFMTDKDTNPFPELEDVRDLDLKLGLNTTLTHLANATGPGKTVQISTRALAKQLGRPQSVVSKYLTRLRKMNLLSVSKVGEGRNCKMTIDVSMARVRLA